MNATGNHRCRGCAAACPHDGACVGNGYNGNEQSKALDGVGKGFEKLRSEGGHR